MKKILQIIVLLCLIAQPIEAGISKGTSIFQFLRIDTSARVSSFSSAFVGLADDVYALESNPAGLGFIVDKQVQASYLIWFEGVYLNHLSWVIPFGKGISIGASYKFLSAEDTYRDENGNETGNIKIDENATVLSFGFRLTDYLSIGGNYKFIYSKLDDLKANSDAFDIGMLFKDIIPKIKFGIAIQNLGEEAGYDSTGIKYSIPKNIAGGFSYQSSDFIFSSEVLKPNDNILQTKCGIEYHWVKPIFIRAGINYMQNLNFSFGIGFEFARWSFDYAFLPYYDLGLTHQFSLKKRF